MENVFFQSLIDVDLWNAAVWPGVGYLHDDKGAQPPGFGLIFENLGIGKRIFAGWLDRIGKDDAYEEIRVSIIKGEILGLPPGYSVQISSDPAHTEQRSKDEV
jgi:hypothetical protein